MRSRRCCGISPYNAGDVEAACLKRFGHLGRLEVGAHVTVGTPARITDHLKRAALEALDLRNVVLPAMNGQDVEAFQMRGIAPKGFRHLYRELAGRHEHQGLRAGEP